jgi:hypothetical protein
MFVIGGEPGAGSSSTDSEHRGFHQTLGTCPELRTSRQRLECARLTAAFRSGDERKAPREVTVRKQAGHRAAGMIPSPL